MVAPFSAASRRRAFASGSSRLNRSKLIAINWFRAVEKDGIAAPSAGQTSTSRPRSRATRPAAVGKSGLLPISQHFGRVGLARLGDCLAGGVGTRFEVIFASFIGIQNCIQ